MDIPLLAVSILERAMAGLGRPVKGFAPGVLEHMAAYVWPGNVRELMNEIQRMLGCPTARSWARNSSPPRSASPTRQRGRMKTPACAARSMPGNQAAAGNPGPPSGKHHPGGAGTGLSRLGLRSKMQRLGVERPARQDKVEET